MDRGDHRDFDLGQEILVVERIKWDSQTETHFSLAGAVDATVSDTWLRTEVMAGRAAVYGVFHKRVRVASVAVKVERSDLGMVMVILCAGGNLPGRDMTSDVVPYFEKLALHNGIAQMRIHTFRRGLVRKLERLGFALSEYVVRKDLTMEAINGR